MTAEFSSNLLTIAICLAAAYKYGDEEDRRDIELAREAMRELAVRYDTRWEDVGDDWPDLESKTCRELARAYLLISHEDGIGGGPGEDAESLNRFHRAIVTMMQRHGRTTAEDERKSFRELLAA